MLGPGNPVPGSIMPLSGTGLFFLLRMYFLRDCMYVSREFDGVTTGFAARSSRSSWLLHSCHSHLLATRSDGLSTGASVALKTRAGRVRAAAVHGGGTLSTDQRYQGHPHPSCRLLVSFRRRLRLPSLRLLLIALPLGCWVGRSCRRFGLGGLRPWQIRSRGSRAAAVRACGR